MEVSYVIIPVIEGRETVFNNELREIFPLSKIKYVTIQSQRLLVLFTDIDIVLGKKICSEEVAYKGEEDIIQFSRMRPYLKCMFIYMIYAGENIYYEGFVARNKRKLVEASGTNDSYIKLITEIIPDYSEYSFLPFTREFVKKI
ncbi:hypothetical protein [Myroides injenensis]|uniref:hypothetical protein n=1 Tax=Myroides injenensis TaxID=1183151 RepID=UPI00028A1589|nr:hypothetical protein [Myroides injenensis]